MLNASKPFGEKGTGFLSGKFREARTRLTLVYVFILALILLLSSGSIYSLFSRQLNTRFARFHPRVTVILPNDFISPNPSDVRTDLIESLLIVNGFLLLAASIASYWLAGLTLEPIQEAYERQRRFLSDASHELRTPLAILQTDLENELIATPAKSAARHQIESHLEEVGRMSQLVGNLLLLSRLDERTEAHHQTTRLHVSDVIEESADRLQSIAQRYDVTIRIEPLDKDAQFITNKELLMQALSNVIKNAITYNNPEGTVTISFETSNKQVVIRITDTGIGIPTEDLAQIFHRFYRTDESRSRTTGGSGLGLSIVQTIMQQLNGSVEIESEFGIGTTVTLYLPSV